MRNVAFHIGGEVFGLTPEAAEGLMSRLAAAIRAEAMTPENCYIPIRLSEEGMLTKIDLHVYFAQSNAKRGWLAQNPGKLWAQMCFAATENSINFELICTRCGWRARTITNEVQNCCPHLYSDNYFVIDPGSIVKFANQFLISGKGYRGPAMKQNFLILLAELKKMLAAVA